MRSDVFKRHQKTCGTNQKHGGARNKKEQILEFEKSTYKQTKNKDSTLTEAAKFLRNRENIITLGKTFARFL